MLMLPLKNLGVPCISKLRESYASYDLAVELYQKRKRCITVQSRNFWHLNGQFVISSDIIFYMHQKLRLNTGNNPLVYVLSSAKFSATGQRWVNELADLNLQIHYKPGRNHQDADALSRFPENIHQYTSRAEQSSINAIFEGVQTQSENEEAWLCAINTSETTPEVDISPLHKNNLQQVDIYQEQNQDHCIKKVKDIQSRVQLSLSQKQREPQLVKRLLREKEKLFVNNKGVLIRRTAKVDQIVIPPSLKNLVYQELHEKIGHLGGERVYQLAKDRFYWPGMEKDIKDHIKNKCTCRSQRKPNVLPQAPLEQ